jgi:hypothetical protein
MSPLTGLGRSGCRGVPRRKAVGKGEPVERSPARGGIALTKTLMSPLAGLCERETIIPALFALGHIMPALTGLAGADTDRSSYL